MNAITRRSFQPKSISWLAETRHRAVQAPSLVVRLGIPASSRPSFLQHQLRTITNASKPDYVQSLTSVPRVEAKPGGWHPTLVHSSGEVKFTVIRLQPGKGEVPSHLHNAAWDYFMPLSGEAFIEVKTKDGKQMEYAMKPGSFLAVPPEDIHVVKNASEKEEFVFFIAQAPRAKYDFVAK